MSQSGHDHSLGMIVGIGFGLLFALFIWMEHSLNEGLPVEERLRIERSALLDTDSTRGFRFMMNEYAPLSEDSLRMAVERIGASCGLEIKEARNIFGGRYEPIRRGAEVTFRTMPADSASPECPLPSDSASASAAPRS